MGHLYLRDVDSAVARVLVPKGEAPDAQVPRIVSPEPDEYLGRIYQKFRIRTGKVIPESYVRMVFAVECDTELTAEDVEIYLNCEKVVFKGISTEICEFSDLPVYEVEIPCEIINDTNVFEIATEGKTFTIKHIEIRIN